MLSVLVLAISASRLITALTISEIPQCVRTCISLSTTAHTECSVVDIACLCSNPGYVTALSCCLATQCTSSEQAVAVRFNQQECGSVNRTAPSFVGCSPGSSNITTGGTTPSVNSLASTVSQDPVSEPFTLKNAIPATATFGGRALMTSSCTIPYFAIMTDPAGAITEFPLVGCAANRPGCCPFDDGLNAIITQCPQDYFQTAGGCCPIGFSVYDSALGPEVPCYSIPSRAIVPVKTPTASNLVLITDHVFARKYNLAPPPTTSKLSLGALIGIVINAVFVFLIIVGAIWFIRRRRRSRKHIPLSKGATFPSEEPVLPTNEEPKTHELDTPISTTTGPGSPRPNGGWWTLSPPSSPPAYDSSKGRPLPAKITIAQELPGSTWMHEHHPAFARTTSIAETMSTVNAHPPSTPPAQVSRDGAVLPIATPESDTEIGRSPVVAWPLSSVRASDKDLESKRIGTQ